MRIGISLGGSRLGRALIAALLRRGVAAADIVAAARSPQRVDDLAARGIDVREATYGDVAALTAAFAGVERLYMISGLAGPYDRRLQHRSVVDAAQRAGVSRVVYTSFIDTADDSPFFAWTVNRDTEAFLLVSGLPFTVLRHGMYSDADLDAIPEYVDAGRIANNIGPEGRISYISREDLAVAGVHALLDDGHLQATYDLTGPEAVSQPELAALISGWTDRSVTYETISDEDFAAMIRDPEWADVIVALYASVRQGNCAAVTDDFARLVGRAPRTLAETYRRRRDGA